MRRWLLRLLGIVLFVWILSNIDTAAAWHSLRCVDLKLLLASMCLSPLLLGIKALRWRFLLRLQGIAYPVKRAFVAYLGGIFLGLVTPARLGELSRAGYVSRDQGVSIGSALPSVLVDRAFDLLFLSCLVLVGVSYLFLPLWLAIALVLVALTLLGLLVSTEYAMTFMRRAVAWLSGRWTSAGVAADDFVTALSRLRRPAVMLAGAHTLIGQSLFLTRCYLLAMALDIEVSFVTLSFFIAVVNLVVILPVTIAGVGTRDGTLILLFSEIGLTQEMAVALSTLMLLTVHLWTGSLGAVAWWVRPPLASESRGVAQESS